MLVFDHGLGGVQETKKYAGLIGDVIWVGLPSCGGVKILMEDDPSKPGDGIISAASILEASQGVSPHKIVTF